MIGGKARVGEHVGLGLIHESGELGQLGPELIGDPAPLRLGGVRAVLGESCRHEGGDDAPAALAGVGESVAHGVDSAGSSRLGLSDGRQDPLRRTHGRTPKL